MKIGILTLPLHTNYGGILQAWALQTVLERMGHEVKVINYPLVRKPSYAKSLVLYIYRNIKNRIFGDRKCCTKWYAGRLATFYIRENTDKFIIKYIHNRFVSKLNEITENEFDVFVVGSDQVWRKGYSQWRDICDSFLKFAQNWHVRRIAYAASFGKNNIDEYTECEKKVCADLLKLFEHVSVREHSGVDLCKDVFGVDTIQLIDPTLLLSKEDYNCLIDAIDLPKVEGALFKYVIDECPVINEAIDVIKANYNWKTFCVNGLLGDNNANILDRIQKPVEQWLQAFRDADAVITDSFHACVFSIIYNKPFLVFGNESRGLSRFETILRLTNLEDRLVTSKEEAIQKKHLLTIAPNVYSKLGEYKKKSFDFLKKI